MKIETKKEIAKEWFIELQNIICNSVEYLEKEYGSNIKFKKNKWKHGEFRTIRGKVIEKGGVAFSNVVGKFPKKFVESIVINGFNLSLISAVQEASIVQLITKEICQEIINSLL